jgi:hypothetical protein
VRFLLLVALAAAFVWVALTLAHEVAGLDLLKGGGPFQFPEIRWGFVEDFQ